METKLIQFVRNKKNQPVGVVLATVINFNNTEKVSVGWSLCCKKDKFDKEKAVNIALGRACEGSKIPLPHTIFPEYYQMALRGQKYFKKEVAFLT